MTITILRQAGCQSIPRPYNRADSVDEMVELLEHHIRAESRKTGVSVNDLRYMARENVNKEEPVLRTDGGATRFYAFTPEVC